MNAAEALVRTAVSSGIDICFANPGTTELALVAALDSVPGIRAVLGLFEGVCTGAADGYARMARKPALTLLHLGPGLANGLANLHNARRAHSPVVNLVGQHATWHIASDPPLNSDIESLARPVSQWVRTSQTSESICRDFAEAVSAARQLRGVATLILPADCQAGEALPLPTAAPKNLDAVPDTALTAAAGAIRAEKSAALLLGGDALLSGGLQAAGRIAAATGCTILCNTFPARMERGAGLPPVERIPYYPEQALQRLSDFSTIVLCGAAEPVAFFGTPGIPGSLIPQSCATIRLARLQDDCEAALFALAELLQAPAKGICVSEQRPEQPAGALTPRSLGEAIVSVQSEGVILVDEAATSGLPHFLMSAGAAPFTYLSLTGGAIGQGLPCATGAALACPDRKVIAFQADGSGMYTVQALWTHAREALDVTTIICANRSYRVLRLELARAGIRQPGPTAVAMTDLSHPVLDWIAIARGMGVPASRAETADSLARQLRHALAEPGPHLIEAVLTDQQ